MESLLVPALIGGVLNRFAGYENIKWLPGRNIYYSILAATALTFAFYGWQWALAIFVGFALYRIPGWYKSLDMGTVGGTLKGDATIMFLRGLMFAPPFLYATYLTLAPGNTADLLAFGLLFVASAGAVLSYIIGNYFVVKFVKDPFWFIEFFAGVSFGTALGYVLQNIK